MCTQKQSALECSTFYIVLFVLLSLITVDHLKFIIHCVFCQKPAAVAEQ